MREILEDLEAGNLLSDPDPVRRAQLQSKIQLPKRFYKNVSVDERAGAFAVLLDGRPVRTPGRAVLALPNKAAALLVANEFDAQQIEINPMTMPVMRLANSVVDGVANDPGPVADEIVRFAGTDLLYYRAESPVALVERQAAVWDPVIAWASNELGQNFVLTSGIIHVEQPAASLAAVNSHIGLRSEPFRLAALHVLTTLTGSALLALAIEAHAISADAAWAAAHVDEDWQAEFWGADAEAEKRRAYRKSDFDGAVELLMALDQS
jgi:chaperone required for assembly of F1-ATPase